MADETIVSHLFVISNRSVLKQFLARNAGLCHTVNILLILKQVFGGQRKSFYDVFGFWLRMII